jgi:aldehyde dehydrogenase (NAD(P)+)
MNRAELDRAIDSLHEHKDGWVGLPVREKMDLLVRMQHNLAEAANRWVSASVEAKQIDPDSPWVGEEWVSGPWAMATAINGLLKSLEALAEGRKPRPKKVRTMANGQVAARVFPDDVYDKLLFHGVTADVWMQPGVAEENLDEHTAAFYSEPHHSGCVALVLGGGNINSIAPLDVLYRLFACGHVVMLKMHPVNEYLGSILEGIFAPFVERGYVRFVYGGAETGSFLCHHEWIEEIHITGSARTHDIIVYGPGEEGRARKRRGEAILKKPITSELGGIGPAIIVPGPWSPADIRYQAERLATAKLHNSGFNCVSSQLLVTSETWPQRDELLEAVRQIMHELPPRHAFYPGAAERHEAALEAHPAAEVIHGNVPRTLITGLDPNDEDVHAFQEEFFGPVYSQTDLPGDSPAEFLTNAVAFCNEKVMGTLGIMILVHPKTMKELGPALDEAIAQLRYGSIGLNIWDAAAFLLPQMAWGAYPGHTLDDVQSGIGVVHNTYFFEKPQKNVVQGPFYPFPRSILNGHFTLSPRPAWFVTNKTAHTTAERVTRLNTDPAFWRLPGIFASGFRGAF